MNESVSSSKLFPRELWPRSKGELGLELGLENRARASTRARARE